jgi:simple sugar transport system ATP-binding protein
VTEKLTLRGITKRFPGIVANDSINIMVEAGSIHALVGENGAGKTTLMNILYGLYQPDEGEIRLDGQTVRFHSPHDAIARHIGMVHQHFMLVPRLTVTENIMVGREVGNPLRLDRKEAERRIAALAAEHGFSIDPAAHVADLTVSEQQRVEILKLLYRQAKILIFDEPTAVLAPQQIDEFCQVLLDLKAMGKTIIFISHKLAEVMRTADRITVIRLGKVVATLETAGTNPQELTRLMVGRDVDLAGRRPESPSGPGTVVLAARDLSYATSAGVHKLDGITFELRAGEILGVAGVDGNGQDELVRVLVGMLRADSGSITFRNRDVTGDSIGQRKRSGIALVPEDRHSHGLVLGFSVEENLILGQHREPRFCAGGVVLRQHALREHALRQRTDYDIRCPAVSIATANLSGGNQQKVVLAREMTSGPQVVVAVQPTRGLDVGAIEFVRKTLIEARNAGMAVLLFSLELDEIQALADRIMVLHRGAVVGIVDARKVTRQELGRMMLGSGQPEGGDAIHA